jgi:hypothetical protein
MEFARCIASEEKCKTCSENAFLPKAVYQIKEIIAGRLYVFIDSTGRQNGWSQEFFEPWIPEVGDNVLITSASSGKSSFLSASGYKGVLTSPISIAKDVWECKIIDDEFILDRIKWIVQSRHMVPIIGIVPVNNKLTIQEEKWPHVCPNCGAPAYIGFSNIDCSKKCR